MSFENQRSRTFLDQLEMTLRSDCSSLLKNELIEIYTVRLSFRAGRETRESLTENN